jgi:hypothetical protein
MSVVRAIEKAYKQKEEKGWSKMYFAFDIHGTILKPNYESGNIPKDFYPFARTTLQFISGMEDVVMILYTCSHPHEIELYLEYFKLNGIRFDYVNENPEIKTNMEGYGNYDKKPYMNVLFEDKCGFLGESEWGDVYHYLINHG